MRISDWSSDVCSSDLRLKTPAAPPVSGAAHSRNASSREADPFDSARARTSWIRYMDQTLLEVRVTKKTLEPDHLASFELKNCKASSLPLFTAGSQIDLKMSNDLVRQYTPCTYTG